MKIIKDHSIFFGRLVLGLKLLPWIALFVAAVLYHYGFYSISRSIVGKSMLPKYKPNTEIPMYHPLKKPQRGDIVIFKSPQSSNDLVKRVIATEGDRISFKNQEVYLNDAILEEPYLATQRSTTTFEGAPIQAGWETLVPTNHVFVMGDNRMFSEDSRGFGTIPISKITEILPRDKQ